MGKYINIKHYSGPKCSLAYSEYPFNITLTCNVEIITWTLILNNIYKLEAQLNDLKDGVPFDEGKLLLLFWKLFVYTFCQ